MNKSKHLQKYVIDQDSLKTIDIDTKFGVCDTTVYRIRALKSFTTAIGITVNKGDLGGYVGGYKNLSQDGRGWIFDDSIVTVYGKVLCDAVVKNSSKVFSHTLDYQDICDRGVITMKPNLTGHQRPESKRQFKIDYTPEELCGTKQSLTKLRDEILSTYGINNAIPLDIMMTTYQFNTKDEYTDNVVKSFSGMNHIYIVKEFNL